MPHTAKPRIKFFLAILTGVVAWFIIPLSVNGLMYNFLLAWVAFAFVILGFDWYAISTVSHEIIRKQSEYQDLNHKMFVLMIIVTYTVSLVSVYSILFPERAFHMFRSLQIILPFLALILSWFMMHTLYAIRYAHLFYGDSNRKEPGGLIFEETENPDFMDCAYFSFGIGMTFQVSDVTISSRSLRRTVLLHSIISFFFNTIIVALTINVLAAKN